jgi:hypothetical protein
VDIPISRVEIVRANAPRIMTGFLPTESERRVQYRTVVRAAAYKHISCELGE